MFGQQRKAYANPLPPPFSAPLPPPGGDSKTHPPHFPPSIPTAQFVQMMMMMIGGYKKGAPYPKMGDHTQKNGPIPEKWGPIYPKNGIPTKKGFSTEKWASVPKNWTHTKISHEKFEPPPKMGPPTINGTSLPKYGAPTTKRSPNKNRAPQQKISHTKNSIYPPKK